MHSPGGAPGEADLPGEGNHAAMIDVKHLTKYYGHTLAVDDISFHVEKGAVVGFLGPNGAGKSTTLKILTCYMPASSGHAMVAGHDVFADSMAVRRNIGYMPESVPLYGEMRVREYLRFRASLRGLRGEERQTAIDRVCQQCWLSTPEDMTARPIDQLSRGYRQRVGLAEALLHSPPVLVLDEPTVGLDPNQIRQMRSLIKELGEQHTVIFSSHILAEAEQVCSQIVIIAGGRIAAAGRPEELRQKVTGPSRLIVELKSAEGTDFAAALRQLPGAREVEASPAGNWVRLTVAAEGQCDLRSDVFQLAARQGWQLRELRRQVGSLEDYFVQITYQQQLAAAERKAGVERPAARAGRG